MTNSTTGQLKTTTTEKKEVYAYYSPISSATTVFQQQITFPTTLSRTRTVKMGNYISKAKARNNRGQVAQIGSGSDAKYIPEDRTEEEMEERKAVAAWKAKTRPPDRSVGLGMGGGIGNNVSGGGF